MSLRLRHRPGHRSPGSQTLWESHNKRCTPQGSGCLASLLACRHLPRTDPAPVPALGRERHGSGRRDGLLRRRRFVCASSSEHPHVHGLAGRRTMAHAPAPGDSLPEEPCAPRRTALPPRPPPGVPPRRGLRRGRGRYCAADRRHGAIRATIGGRPGGRRGGPGRGDRLHHGPAPGWRGGDGERRHAPLRRRLRQLRRAPRRPCRRSGGGGCHRGRTDLRRHRDAAGHLPRPHGPGERCLLATERHPRHRLVGGRLRGRRRPAGRRPRGRRARRPTTLAGGEPGPGGGPGGDRCDGPGRRPLRERRRGGRPDVRPPTQLHRCRGRFLPRPSPRRRRPDPGRRR